ncbi:MAG TPA: DNA helicase, partial [Kaistia sp.]|nr:DNA helicase [Kaistia sp.]
FQHDSSDAIHADHIAAALATAPPGTLAVIDYLQLLDQRRANPDLMTQVRTLRALARERGLILVFLSQIDRSYDPAAKPLPDLGDVRLPNPLDLALFDKACFLSQGEIRIQTLR